MSVAPAAAEAVLDFWLGAAANEPAAVAAASKRWFRGGETLDREIAQRFGTAIEAALDGGLEEWAASPRGRLALVILLDQFTRNVHRGTARAFAGDARARALTEAALESGEDRALTHIERLFLYLPLEHAEEPAAQERSVEAQRRLAAEAPAELAAYLADCVTHAEEHRDVVARFGRFPHRNTALGRETTPEERTYLEAGARRYGQ
ncbi:MAG: DUF924 domain-containing protein [Chromatiales bacterium]|nr:DUF924 domain-containing protein [Chromatiales bacterium]